MDSNKTPTAVLSINDISLSFGGVQALSDVSMEILEGEICSIIGPNGAGKSSLLNVVNGTYTPRRGRISLDGREFRSMRPRKAAKLGIARSFQNIGLIGGMSVVDNLMLGRNLMFKSTFVEQALYLGRARREAMRQRRSVEEIIEFFQIESVRKTLAGSLAHGMQKRVELARALAAEPRLLLLDEPMAGMDTEERLDFARLIQEINAEFDTTIVLIGHDIGAVMDISDHIIAMDFGRKIADSVPDEIKNNPEVLRAYRGTPQ